MQIKETKVAISADMLRIAADTQRLGFVETAEAMRHLAELFAEFDRGHAPAEAGMRSRRA